MIPIILHEIRDINIGGDDGAFCIWDWRDKNLGEETVDEVTVWGDSVVSLWMSRSPLKPLGIRRDYRIGDDGITRICHEDRSLVYHDTLSVPVCLPGFLAQGDSLVSSVAKTGRMYQRYNMSAIGSSTLKSVGRGTMILPTNDTIYNVHLTWRKEMLTHYGNDGNVGDTVVVVSPGFCISTEQIDEYLWFAEGIRYPVARLTHRCLIPVGGEATSETETFVCIPSMQSAEAQEALFVNNNHKTRVKGRGYNDNHAGAEFPSVKYCQVNISTSAIEILPQNSSEIPNEIILTDIPGRVFYNGRNVCAPISIERSSLPTGDYILWIRVGNEYTSYKIPNR